MGTGQSFVDHVMEVAGLGSRLTHKKLFGEYALDLDGTTRCRHQALVTGGLGGHVHAGLAC